ncbi:MAG: PAS domain S-box protein [Deltaproteobacteria bacterium]|nr:PAS domain S-box protein [Deltaproteobacteria bacterium]
MDIQEISITEAGSDPKGKKSFYQLATEGSLAGVYLIQAGKFIYVNAAMARVFGYSPEEITSGRVGLQDLVHSDDLALVRKNLRQRLAGEADSLHYTFKGKRRDGAIIYCEVLGKRVEYEGSPAVMGALLDITAKKTAEEALKASEANYHTIFNSSNDGIAVIEIDTGKFLEVNRRWMKITGYNKDETAQLTFAPFCLNEPPFTQEDGWGWFRKATAEGPQVFEWKFKNKRGKLQLVEVNLNRTSIGGKDCILANVRDISARKHGEAELRLSEAKYRNLVEQIPAITFVAAMDSLGSALYISPQIKDILGFTPEEWLADPEIFKNHIHPEDRDRVLTELLLSYSQGGPFAAEYRMLSKSGQVIWIRDESRAVFDSSGRPLFVQGVAMDITKLKKSEEALREANSKLNALVQASPLAIVGLDVQGKVISWNHAAESIFGWRQDEIIGRPLPIVPPDKVAEFKELYQRELRGERLVSLELRRQRKDGSPVDICLSTAPLYDATGKLTGFVGIIDDITARKRTEEALRTSEARFRAMFEGAPIGIAVADLQQGTIIGNPALREMSGGFSEAEINRINGEEVTHPDDWEADSALFAELISGKRNRFQKETRYRHKQGHWIWARLSVSLVKDATGQPHFAICMVEDVTQRRKAEETTEEIRRQQEAILNNISDIAWLKDRESRLIVANEQYGRSCGVAPADLVGKTDLDIWPRDLALRYLADDQEVMKTAKRKRVEEPLADKEGNIAWIETIKTPIFNERREVIGTAGVARDITERRKMEEDLRQVSRALKAVTECHQALMRATNEAELLSEVCRIIVEAGGYRMAWVGYARQDEGKGVEPVAHKGFEKGYMQTLKLTWADEERGWGPTGTAIRTGKPAITRDTQTDPKFAPWREEARKRGFASVLGLPLGEVQPYGALTIYANEPNAFDDEEINLLIGLANDLAFGLKALRTNAERRRAEEALRESEAKYRSLMDGASDAIVLADSRGKITGVNRQAVELLGYSEAEFMGLNYREIHPTRIVDHVLENFKGILTSGRGPLHECLVRRKDGGEIHVDIAHNMVENGGHGVVQAVFRDITERQKSQEALRDSEQKLRLLASQLLAVQEKERHRLSRELHDELGQALTVLKIHLVAIENKLCREQTDLKDSCERLQNYIDAVIENVRRLSMDLSPSILEDLGLSSSLKYLIEEICRNNHMLYSVALDEIDHLFSAEARINIYRIFQESLTNIVRHAEASRIDVEIKRENDRVTFQLKDDGKGFDLKKARSRSLGERGLGLTAMHERALMSDGNLSIRSGKGKGTEITLTLPIREMR